MKLFGQIVRTAIHLTVLPIDISKDLVDSATGSTDKRRTAERLRMLADDSSEEPDGYR